MNTSDPSTVRTAPRPTGTATVAVPAAGPASPPGPPGEAGLLDEIARMLGRIPGMPALTPGLPAPGCEEPFGMDTMLGDDLELESIDLVTLAGHLEERYGERVNLAEFLAGLDIDSIIALTVGDLVRHVRDSLTGPARAAAYPDGPGPGPAPYPESEHTHPAED